MKTGIRNLFSLPVLIAALGVILIGQVMAQTFTTLHSFAHGSDGAYPSAGLILSGNTLYGTTKWGGSLGFGTVFAVNADGTGFTTLYSFTGDSDGANPLAGLILSGDTLYGTASYGGSSDQGTVFAVNTDGTGFTNLYSFTGGSDGAYPETDLILSGNTLYGTTEAGGNSENGTIFAINTNGAGFLILHAFAGYPNDGAYPSAGLILSSNILYGTTENGGSSDTGMVFAVNTDGTGFTNLYSFTASSTNSSGDTNIDGATPEGDLILSGNTLYGTTYGGGNYGDGTVFAINTDGRGFTNLYSFTGGSDGANPPAGLILSGNTLYGTAENGGSSGSGTVFAINSYNTSVTTLYNFAAVGINSHYVYTNTDGAFPRAGLILCGSTLYGTANKGGPSGYGTVFGLSLPLKPQLTITPSGADVILTWRTNAAGFALQSTTNLLSPVIWTTNSPVPVVVNGQNTVTNPISGTQQFFRLSQ